MKKTMAILIIISIFASMALMVSCDNFSSTPQTEEDEIGADKPEKKETVPKRKATQQKPWEDSGAQTAISISDKKGTTIAGKFTTYNPMTYIQFSCPSWSDNIGSITFTLYKWDTDYDKTIAGTPIVTETFVDYLDNSDLLMKIESEDAPPGEYLFVASDGTGGVGMWADNSVSDDYICYKDGKVIKNSLKIIIGGYEMVEQ